MLNFSEEELKQELETLNKEYEQYKKMDLHLDMSRGKPGKEQLDLSQGLLSVLEKNEDCFSQNHTDCRNYGLLDGLPEAKQIFAEILELSPEEIIIGGNSSLNIMYDTISRAMLFGVYGGEPWAQSGKIKFLCPAPGYDRHFTLCETFGIEMIPVAMTNAGPDMEAVKKAVESDEQIKGIWCVPKYSNPDGITYTDETVRAFAALNPKAKDFRIFWDNAYAVHFLDEKNDEKLLSLMQELKKTGKEDMVFMFSSTSKISFPGSGISALGASKNNIELIKKQMFAQTIGCDKMNQLRHIRYYKNADGIRAHMSKHAELLKPRFQAVIDALKTELEPLHIATWHEPKGGYFVSCNLPDGCAKRTVSLLKDAGVIMTAAGATFPYGNDPHDSNIRIAPSFPPVEELKTAMALFCLCAKIAAAEKLLKEKTNK